jgi:hypothetical protein
MIALFSHMVSLIAPGFFENGEASLEAACHDIDQWPAPIPGDTVNLPIMGTVVQVRINNRNDKVIGMPPAVKQSSVGLPSLFAAWLYCFFAAIDAGE